jgi:DNA modification methylase
MEITFKSDTKHRKQFLTANHFAHPAKLVLPLQRWLIENYTKQGETICDPMAGSGTLLLACTMGRNVILVELEEKFVQMQRDNWAKIQTIGPEMGSRLGTATILQGDARNLQGILCDSIITSPPYEASVNVPDSKPEARAERLRRAGYNPKDYQGGKGRNLQQDWSYAPKADAIITSPPYEDKVAMQDTEFYRKKCLNTGRNPQSPHAQGIGSYTDKADAIITSPPYENQATGQHGGGIDWSRAEEFGTSTKGTGMASAYSAAKENIGNLKGQLYLQAMALVYQQCHSVLKDGGLMAIVVKNFIRDKKIVRLDLDTIKLCEQANFQLVERHFRKLTQQSFWRTLYQQKYPDAPVIDKEDILIFRKMTK